MRLLFLLAFLPVITIACYSGYNSVFDGKCLERGGSYMNYDQVKSQCEAEDSQMLMFKTKEEQDQYMIFFDNNAAWLGLKCNGEKFVWEDGTDATYTNFQKEQICNAENVNPRFYVQTSDGKWISQPSSTSNTLYPVCLANSRSWVCDTYHLLQQGKSDDTCYLIVSTLTAQPQAESNCQSQRAHISPIHDQAFNDYLKRTAVSYGMTNGIHIGLKYVDGKYVWSDGSDIDYTYWAPGFPDESFGECVAMGINLFPGKWINAECSTPLPYICTKDAFVYDETVAPEGCSDDNEFYPGDEIFSPTWGSATGPALCDYAVMDLDKSKKVTVEIIFFESNACCDILTIYDGLVGSTVLKTLRGYYGLTSMNVTANSNAIRMEWNAKSGAHVRGWHAKVTSA